eukprot:4836207-Prymnesium_polylepis.1
MLGALALDTSLEWPLFSHADLGGGDVGEADQSPFGRSWSIEVGASRRLALGATGLGNVGICVSSCDGEALRVCAPACGDGAACWRRAVLDLVVRWTAVQFVTLCLLWLGRCMGRAWGGGREAAGWYVDRSRPVSGVMLLYVATHRP